MHLALPQPFIPRKKIYLSLCPHKILQKATATAGVQSTSESKSVKEKKNIWVFQQTDRRRAHYIRPELMPRCGLWGKPTSFTKPSHLGGNKGSWGLLNIAHFYRGSAWSYWAQMFLWLWHTGKSHMLNSPQTHTSICAAWRSTVTTLSGKMKQPGILA